MKIKDIIGGLKEKKEGHLSTPKGSIFTVSQINQGHNQAINLPVEIDEERGKKIVKIATEKHFNQENNEWDIEFTKVAIKALSKAIKSGEILKLTNQTKE